MGQLTMKLKIVWTALTLILGYGLLPVTLPDTSNNFDNPNTLIIRRQECGCPCADGLIMKGQLEFSRDIKNRFPALLEKVNEITLTNFPPFEVSMDHMETFYFANEDVFKITGQTIGVDSIQCGGPSEYQIVPRFRVDTWSLTFYKPRFSRLSIILQLAYFGLAVIVVPVMLILTFVDWKKRKRSR
jgi:hypothetical protein